MSTETKQQFVQRFTLTMAAETMAFRRTLNAESDRGVALMAAAYLDDQLRQLIEFMFIDDSTVCKMMLESRGPCATFSSRIDLAYLMGLISKLAHGDLTLIRKIRNDFAHRPEPMGFGDQSVSSRCRELSWCGDEVASQPRAKFVRSSISHLAEIHSAYLLIPIRSKRSAVDRKVIVESDVIARREEIAKKIQSGELKDGDWIAIAQEMIQMCESGQSSEPKSPPKAIDDPGDRSATK